MSILQGWLNTILAHEEKEQPPGAILRKAFVFEPLITELRSAEVISSLPRTPLGAILGKLVSTLKCVLNAKPAGALKLIRDLLSSDLVGGDDKYFDARLSPLSSALVMFCLRIEETICMAISSNDADNQRSALHDFLQNSIRRLGGWMQTSVRHEEDDERRAVYLAMKYRLLLTQVRVLEQMKMFSQVGHVFRGENVSLDECPKLPAAVCVRFYYYYAKQKLIAQQFEEAEGILNKAWSMCRWRKLSRSILALLIPVRLRRGVWPSKEHLARLGSLGPHYYQLAAAAWEGNLLRCRLELAALVAHRDDGATLRFIWGACEHSVYMRLLYRSLRLLGADLRKGQVVDCCVWAGVLRASLGEPVTDAEALALLGKMVEIRVLKTPLCYGPPRIGGKALLPPPYYNNKDLFRPCPGASFLSARPASDASLQGFVDYAGHRFVLRAGSLGQVPWSMLDPPLTIPQQRPHGVTYRDGDPANADLPRVEGPRD